MPANSMLINYPHIQLAKRYFIYVHNRRFILLSLAQNLILKQQL